MAKSLKLIIEALLFASEKPLRERDIHACLPDAKIADIKNALKILEHEYESLERSFDLKEIAEGYQFRTRSEYGPYILSMLQTSPGRLSRAALETLAIIAYKQPVIRVDVEAIRGVGCGEMIRQLCDKGMVKIVGRAEVLGRPLLYGTTRKFLEVFGLSSLKDLPQAEQLKAPY